MNVIVTAAPTILVCPHCDGTTLCAHSLLSEADRSKGDKRLVPRCTRCGDGIARYAPLFGALKETRPPVCAVCSGHGYLSLR